MIHLTSVAASLLLFTGMSAFGETALQIKRNCRKPALVQ